MSAAAPSGTGPGSYTGDPDRRLHEPRCLSASRWYMSFGERAAVTGVLADLRPRVCVEVGSADGGSLLPVAEWGGVVHSFDLRPPPAERQRDFEDVIYHTGDSHELLPTWLKLCEADGTQIEYAMIDGDHSPLGVEQDVSALLSSTAFTGVMLVHDTMNPSVRRGLEAINFDRFPNVTFVDFDFVQGRMLRTPERYQLWGGVGMIVVDPKHTVRIDKQEAMLDGIRSRHYVETISLLAPVRQLLLVPHRLRQTWRQPGWAFHTLKVRLSERDSMRCWVQPRRASRAADQS